MSVAQAQDMKTLFANMPDAYLPQLEAAWRKDLIDLYLAGKEAKLQNTMGGYSTLEELTEDYVRLRSTSRSTLELKCLPLINHTHILCAIVTVEGPVPDSRVMFYTLEWQALEASSLFTPASPEAFVKEASRTSDSLARLDMTLIKYSLSPTDLSLRATLTTPLYLSEEERAEITPHLNNEPLTFTWDNSRFR
jgi:hypothetical protein